MKAFLSLILLIIFTLPAHAADLKQQQPGDRVFGSNKAKITVIEYASLSCPHCAAFHQTVMPTIEKDYIETNKVKLIVRDYPLNASALFASKAVACVVKTKGEDRYYPLIQKLFLQQKDWAWGKDFESRLIDILVKGKDIGEAELKTCMADKDIEKKILLSKQTGDKLEIKSTPTFFVNGVMNNNIQTVKDARTAFDQILMGKAYQAQAKAEAKKILQPRPDDIIFGRPKAKLSIVEYNDVSCPYCNGMHQMLIKALLNEYITTGKVNLIYRERPMSPAGVYGFMLAHCKRSEGFFSMLDELSASSSEWAASPFFLSKLQARARAASIDKDKFLACISNEKTEARISTNLSEAKEKLDIRSPMAIYVDGELIPPPQNEKAIRTIVDEALKKKRGWLPF